MNLKLSHMMTVTVVLAIVFAVLTRSPLQSALGIGGIVALLCGWYFYAMLRRNPLKQVLATLPNDPDEQIAVLEQGLEACNAFDTRSIAQARYLLMKLYRTENRHEQALDQGRAVLRLRDVEPSLENEVRREIAFCLELLGRTEEASMERMAAGDDVGRE
jgi:hypothetical protein